MKIAQAFNISILSYNVENWSEHKDEIIDMLDTEECDGCQTDYFKYHEQNKIPPYADKLFEILQPALKEFDGAYPKKFDIHNVWGQRYGRGGYHQLHNHGALGYSAILYASLQSDHQATTFFAPYLDFVEGNMIEYVPEVEEGDIIFFPSCLAHQCRAVQSDSERIVFSFNIRNA